jgi:methionyl-tRNA synthetase
MDTKKPTDRLYITTTLPYVNADPHIGFAAELIRADIIARFQEHAGKKVFFNTGTDEHGAKIYRNAQAVGKSPQEYVDSFAMKFQALKDILSLKDGLNFIRTTDENHVRAAEEFWRRCNKNGYIYKKKYATKYCVGCELEKTDSELENGRCPLHPNQDVELIEEENYFFKFSEFKDKLLAFYDAHPQFVIPQTRFNEIKAFVARGLQDFSISRLKAKMPWGIEVPGDHDHVMYVWFDALVNYIAAVGWPDDEKKFNEWWRDADNVIQYCGKDNLRQQSAMWQAMLMAAGLPNSQQIIINGFVTGDGGIKMSKSLGNVINPIDIVNEYGADALRYFVARELLSFEDSPFTTERFKEAYNVGLANGLGNLASRIMKMAEANLELPVTVHDDGIPRGYMSGFEAYDLKKVADVVWDEIKKIDTLIQETQPFKVVKEDAARGKGLISDLVQSLWHVSTLLLPILPDTARKIQNSIKENKMPATSLFPRKD